MSRRAALCVPANEPRKVAKALGSPADEVVVDLEDAVPVDEKVGSRSTVADLPARDHGALAVRVNAVGTPWHEEDVAACAANPAVDSIVLPKAESAASIRALGERLEALESAAGRTRPLRIQALIESPAGVHQAAAIGTASERLCALIIGYADLSASMGRRVEASWQFAQDAVLLAARLGGVEAIDGPQLTVADDERLAGAARSAADLGFDGKWVIHPAQIGTVQTAFTPSPEEIAEAREIVAVIEHAATEGRGALTWRGRMLDEALAVSARRTLDRSTGKEPA
ncbi:CoA ester lyase [Aeromicrobium senzhongii]|uniref:CoA ester lyase n=1 Tax=Aeromicrobium senzhongii TaxID=2663859 RepID=A0ABX6SQY2_9ACTN|nr:CoA ester lyase [Aeromicrobium senzhongii]MTB88940.1 CoA ester lyase [Aeromicrobium senzhongii]QNL93779.1 CoA ester lyase [Aeromicrobium senzhongii]